MSHAQQSTLVLHYSTEGYLTQKRLVPPSGVLGATPIFLFFPKQDTTETFRVRNYGGASFQWKIESFPNWAPPSVTNGNESPDLSPSGGTVVSVSCQALTGSTERRDSMKIIALDGSTYLSPTWVYIIQVPDSAVSSVEDETEVAEGSVAMIQYGNDRIELSTRDGELIRDFGVYQLAGGRVLQQDVGSTASANFYTSEFASGVYFVLVRTKTNRVVLKKFAITR
jgi:hypothetical protein